MSVSFYMDENIERAITLALRARGVDALMAQDDGHSNTADDLVFNRANELGRVLVSEDTDMLVEAAGRLRRGERFAGVVFWRQQSLSLGAVIRDLELISAAAASDELCDQILFLPL